MSEKIKVLIIDDHYMVRRGLIALLENFDDFIVVGDVGDARIGVEMCNQHRPDVVLMDIVMPGMDGVSATRAIRSSCPETQVVALTSFHDEERVQEALKAGAIGYLMKNVSVDELANAVRRAHQGQPTLAPEAAQALISATVRPPALGHDLTEREREVLSLMVEGLNNREIAERLVISNSTVKNHVSNILDKLRTSSRTQAVAMAVEHRIIGA
ncbi:MAG: response regulator transcription factor [Anaerolineae bacterium]|nr:response regulator transcription factor [Anaerolineae bacterium]